MTVIERDKAASMLPLAAEKVAAETQRIADIKSRKALRPGWLDGALRAAGVHQGRGDAVSSSKPAFLVTGADLAPQALALLGDYEVVFAGKTPTEDDIVAPVQAARSGGDHRALQQGRRGGDGRRAEPAR